MDLLSRDALLGSIVLYDWPLSLKFNIGQAYKKLGRSPQALAWYEDALAEGAFEPALEEIVVNIINDLRQQIGLAPRE